MSQSNRIIWIIGLPNSGKTLLAESLIKEFQQQQKSVILLDGDAFRKVLSIENSHYALEQRIENALRIGRLASLLQSQGHTIIVAANTLFKFVQEKHRQTLESYFEIYLRSDEETRRSRDQQKKLYQRFDRSEISNIPGLDLPADEPQSPDIVLENYVDTNISALISQLKKALL